MVPFFSGEATSVAASGTQNYRCGQGTVFSSNATEANRNSIYRTAGTFSKLYITILTNDHGASTFRTRINSANANLLLSIGASATGEFEDTTNSDTIVAGDTVGYRLVTGAGGAAVTFTTARVIFTSATNVSTVFATTATAISGTTLFMSMVANSGSSGTEDRNQIKSPIAVTWRYLGIYVSTNTRDGAVTFISRVNTANGNQTVSIGSTLTGWFEDLVNTDTIAVGDLINYSGVTGGTTGAVTTQTTKSALESTLRQFIFGGNGALTTNASTTVYYPPGGDSTSANATESNVVGDAGSSFVASNIDIFVSANTVVGASTFRLRVNAANVNQVASITGLTTGHFTDAVNTDSILTTDSLAHQLVTGAAGTSLTTRAFSVKGQLAALGGGSTLLYMGVG